MKSAFEEVTLLRHEHGWIIRCPAGLGLATDLFDVVSALPDVPTRGKDRGGWIVPGLARYYKAVIVIAFTQASSRRWRAELREQLKTEYPDPTNSWGTRLARWVIGPDSGASSTYLAKVLSERLRQDHGMGPIAMEASHYLSNAEAAAPLDDHDFRRCVVLLEAVPELRPLLETTLAGVATWAPWVDGWDERAARLGPAPE